MNAKLPILLGLAVCLPLGCNSGPMDNNMMPPPDVFDPGPRPPTGGYGSGSGSGGMPMPMGPPMCAEPQRRCATEFVYQGSAMMPLTGKEKSVELHGSFDGWGSGAPMSFDGMKWSVAVPLQWQTKIDYKFHIIYMDGSDKWLADPANMMSEDDGFGGKNSVLSGVTCKDWTCAPAMPMCTGPTTGGYDWRDAVLYFTFVDRFANGDPSNDHKLNVSGLADAANWQGGDWAGISQKIQAGYFQGLGVNTLWLSVPMKNGDSTGLGDDGHLYSGYHAYWPLDLDNPEERFGSEAELQGLVAAAHKAGIKIILDYSMHHLYKDAQVYKDHPEWFWGLNQAGQQCICGTGACGWDDPTYGTRCWFRDYLPTFNFTLADARKYSVDNAIKWIQQTGADGFRLDAVKQIDISWIDDLRTRLTSDVEPGTKQHVYLVGETFDGNRDVIKRYVDPCKMLDGQFDFPLRAQLNSNVLLRQGQMKDLQGFMDTNTGYYGSGLMSTFLGNHDVPRVIHFAQDKPIWTDPWAGGKDINWMNQPGVVAEKSAYERLSVAFGVLFTNQGIPLIYYGDEVGMPGAGDPDNRRFMQWDGYNDGQNELLGRIKKMLALRAAHSALRRGTRTTLSAGGDTWAYQMTDGGDQVIVALNRGDSDQMVSGLPAGKLSDQMTGDVLSGPTVTVPARSVRILTH